jgi:hypothetical protein
VQEWQVVLVAQTTWECNGNITGACVGCWRFTYSTHISVLLQEWERKLLARMERRKSEHRFW